MKNRFEWLDISTEGREILAGVEEYPGPVSDCHGTGDAEYLVYDRKTDTVYTTGALNLGGQYRSAVELVEETVLEQEAP